MTEQEANLDEHEDIRRDGTVLRESTIAPTDPGDLGTTIRLIEHKGVWWVHGLAEDVEVWIPEHDQVKAHGRYETEVLELYPLTDPDTDAPTWTTTDVEGVPTPE